MADKPLNNFNSIFSKATKKVLTEYGIAIDFESETITNPTKFIETLGMDVLIYLTEEVEGIFVISLTVDAAINLAKRIDMDPSSVDEELAREIISELGNMSAGRGVAFFQKSGINTNITPPSIFCGVGSRIFSLVPNLLTCTLSTEVGEVKLYSAVRLKEKKVVYV